MAYTNADLARDLGVDRAVVCRHKRMGMPTDSLAAARAWRENNLNPAMCKATNPAKARAAAPPSEEDGLERLYVVARLASLAQERLVSGEFNRHLESALRFTLSQVPRSYRDKVLLPESVLKVLVAETAAAWQIDLDAVLGDAGDVNPAPLSEVWYAVAAREMGPPWRPPATG
jgi:hypothetical protein